MKTMKRFVSVLLSGMMVMMLLTGCFGSGNASIGQKFEDEYLKLVNSMRTEENGKLENDAALRSKALDALNTIDKNGKITADNATKADYIINGDGKSVTMTVVVVPVEEEAQGLQEYTAKEITEENLAKLLQEDRADATVEAMNEISKIGVASLERNGKTYGAIAIEMTVQIGE